MITITKEEYLALRIASLNLSICWKLEVWTIGSGTLSRCDHVEKKLSSSSVMTSRLSWKNKESVTCQEENLISN